MYNMDKVKDLYVDKIDKIVYDYIKIIEDIDYIKKDIGMKSSNERIIYISSILLVLSKVDKYMDRNQWDEVVHNYMNELNVELNESKNISLSLYGGLSNIAFSIYMISKKSFYYNNTLNKLNKLIIDNTYKVLTLLKKQNNLTVDDYDIISGVSGIAAYLLLFDDKSCVNCVRSINEYLVEIINKKNIYGNNVIGLHIKSENQYLEEEKNLYKKGSFNFSLAHGICSILSVLAIAYEKDIICNGQKSAIQSILDVFYELKIENNESIFWKGIISYEEMISFDSKVYKHEPRASWCYGTPGIARSIYMASKAIDDKRTLMLSKKALDYLFNLDNIEKWQLDSPTICHGFAGIMNIINLMIIDDNNEQYIDVLEFSLKNIVNYYNENNKYLFKNIEHYNDNVEYEDSLSFLTGTSGIILSLIAIKNKNDRDVLRMLGID